jgi:hypothetical protein
MVFAFNKGNSATTLEIAGKMGSSASITRLTAPAVDATSGVLLGGTAVGKAGNWTPGAAETAQAKSGKLALTLPAYSAAFVQFA